MGRKNIRFLVGAENAEGMSAADWRCGASTASSFRRPFIPLLQVAHRRLMTMLRGSLNCWKKSAARWCAQGSGSTPYRFSAEALPMLFLHCVNSSLAPLRHLCVPTRTPGRVVCGIVAAGWALCTFSFDSHPARSRLRPRAPADASRLTPYRAHLELIVPQLRPDLLPRARYFYEAGLWMSDLTAPLDFASAATSQADLMNAPAPGENLPRVVRSCGARYTAQCAHSDAPIVVAKIEFQYFA